MKKTIKIDDEIYKLIKKLAQDKNITINQLMIKLLELNLKEMMIHER